MGLDWPGIASTGTGVSQLWPRESPRGPPVPFGGIVRNSARPCGYLSVRARLLRPERVRANCNYMYRLSHVSAAARERGGRTLKMTVLCDFLDKTGSGPKRRTWTGMAASRGLMGTLTTPLISTDLDTSMDTPHNPGDGHPLGHTPPGIAPTKASSASLNIVLSRLSSWTSGMAPRCAQRAAPGGRS